MATIKSFTDLEQSKKLAEFLPLETADMWYHGHGSPWESERKYDSDAYPFHSMKPNWDKPCWSLAALLGILPRYLDSDIVKCPLKLYTFDFENPHIKEHCWIVCYEDYDEEYEKYNFKVEARGNNPVDACVAIIEQLHKLNLL